MFLTAMLPADNLGGRPFLCRKTFGDRSCDII